MPIFDQGYQHWSGETAGHARRWLAISRHGVRIGMKSFFLRILLLFALLPAIALGAALAVWGLVEQKSAIVAPLVSILQDIGPEILGPEVLENPKSYRVEIWTIYYSYFLLAELRFSMILILFVGPSLISQDIRFNALPLYFSRPLRRIDYFLGKLGVIGAFLAMVLIVPSIIAFLLGVIFSLDLSIVVDTFPLLLASILYGVIMAISTGMFILALSSLSRNSRYIGLFWVGAWLITSLVGSFLEAVNREHKAHERYVQMARADANRRAAGQRMTVEEQRKFQEEQTKLFADIANQEMEDAKTDWRPMASYTANLIRVGDAMIGADASWRRLSDKQPPDRRQRFLQKYMGSQYPWQWSAVILFVLFGISACILNFRVKSLDRLK